MSEIKRYIEDNEINIQRPGQILEESIYNNYDLHTSEKKKLLDYITNLQEELKSIKENYKIQLEYDEQLENKIDKAIEYIKKTQMGEGYKKELLDILRGEDNE